ncbi:MAG TPA: hypothetical protein VGS07_21965 [Thermoanaerobaculia bacterium]|jgi:hypothetical protein|nr:hypothetical protein [Thermoanaerobaculia bacterium]
MQCSSKAVLAAFGLTFLALSSSGFAREAAVPARLLTPQAGNTLVAGSSAEIEWAPLARFADLRKAEEWEAFLSVDGGATYPIRITPHLDLDLRRFRFQVPPIPTANARILLRFGDERRETAVELPERFTIAAAPVAASAPDETFHRTRRSFISGEPALPGHAGVVSWVEGSRRGLALRQVVAAEQPGLRAQPSLTETHGEPAVLDSGPAQSQKTFSGTDSDADPLGRRQSLLGRAGSGPSLFIDILLLTQRQNE